MTHIYVIFFLIIYSLSLLRHGEKKKDVLVVDYTHVRLAIVVLCLCYILCLFCVKNSSLVLSMLPDYLSPMNITTYLHLHLHPTWPHAHLLPSRIYKGGLGCGSVNRPLNTPHSLSKRSVSSIFHHKMLVPHAMPSAVPPPLPIKATRVL